MQFREKLPPQQTAKPTRKRDQGRALKTGGGDVGTAGRGAGVGFLAMTALSIGISFTVGLVMGQSPEESIQSTLEAEKEAYTTGEGLTRSGGGMLGGSAGMMWAAGFVASNPELWAGLAAAAVVVGAGYLGAKAGEGLWQSGGGLGSYIYDRKHPQGLPYKLPNGTWVELKYLDLGPLKRWPPDPCENNPCWAPQ